MNTLAAHKYHYFYKITNKITGQFYYGIHSTSNLNDGYMGSGARIKRMYKKYGRLNYYKEILRFFDTREEASDYEHQIVNEELLKNKLCLNLAIGGDIQEREIGSTKGLVTVRNKDGECFDVSKDDPRYISGELIPATKGRVVVRNKEGICISIDKNDPRYISGELTIVSKNNKGGKGRKWILKDRQYKFVLSTELDTYIKDGWILQSPCKRRISPTKGKVHILKNGKSIMVDKNELQSYIDDGWENCRNVTPLKGTICMTKEGNNLYISPEDVQKYIDDGWSRGGTSRNKGKLTCSIDGGKTYIQLDKNDPLVLSGQAKTATQLKGGEYCKGKKYIHKDGVVKRVIPDQLNEYINNGWKLGIKDK